MAASKLHKHRAHVTLLSGPTVHSLYCARTPMSVGSVLNDTRKVKVLSLPETIKEKSTFRAKAFRRELVVWVGENHACFYTS